MKPVVTFEKTGAPGHRSWEATAPAGFCFDGELHTLVEAAAGRAQEEREALADLKKRVAAAQLTPCPNDCDCRVEPAEARNLASRLQGDSP